VSEVAAHLQIVAPMELVAGFRLGGAIVHAPEDAEDAAATVRALIAEGERGVIGVYEPWLASFQPWERERLEESVSPVVVAVPTGLVAAGGAARRARLAELLRRAVGYSITFGEGE
jgi:vacuolar-type H+-ATPase subunit F/Vma7